MNYTLLLPNKYKTIGWYILVPSALIGLFIMLAHVDLWEYKTKTFAIISGEIFQNTSYFSMAEVPIAGTIVGILIITGAMLVAFSKEKTEDEFIANLRLSSLLWAVLVNYILLLLAFAFVYGAAFLQVLIFNMFTVLAIFILRFNYLLYKSSKTMKYEK